MNATDVERNLERIRWLCDPLASTAEAEEFAALAMKDEEGERDGPNRDGACEARGGPLSGVTPPCGSES